jgi:hypothetical protein
MWSQEQIETAGDYASSRLASSAKHNPWNAPMLGPSTLSCRNAYDFH